MSASFPTASVYTDIQGLQSLKNAAGKNSPEALKEVARQFEALFIQNLLKNMRAAKLDDGLMSSDQGDMYLDMFDKQLSLTMTEQKGIGLADMLYDQLKYTLGNDAVSSVNKTKLPNSLDSYQQHPVQSSHVTNNRTEAAAVSQLTATSSPRTEFDSSDEFVKQLWPLANNIAEKLGTSPQMILAQAALETGWGKHILKTDRGGSSFNVFNIKAGNDWEGPVVAKKTLEFLDGKYQQELANFKIYSSYADGFSDYMQHIQQGDKYQQALKNIVNPDQYAKALQQAGYATDPLYSEKIVAVMESERMQAGIELVDKN